jgi:D-alanyl-D-alanine carboxypeptidase
MRRTVLIVAVVVAALALSSASTAPDPPAPRAAARVTLPPPLQVFNGPLAAPGVGHRPLALGLAGAADAVRLRFRHQPRSGLLFDLDSGQVLWRRLPARVLPIASLTKMMTALLVVEHAAAGARVMITRQALAYTGSGVGVLPRGRRIRLETMLYGLLLPSGNDAAIALAQHISGTVPRFVRRMNAQARELGLSCTRFASPSGIVDQGNHSCAIDLAVLARELLDHPRLARIVRHRRIALPFPIKGGKLYLFNNNPLLRLRYPGTIGVKTGFTFAAGRCLVAAARHNGRRLAVVLLHSPDPGGQAMKLLDRGFAVQS